MNCYVFLLLSSRWKIIVIQSLVHNILSSFIWHDRWKIYLSFEIQVESKKSCSKSSSRSVKRICMIGSWNDVCCKRYSNFNWNVSRLVCCQLCWIQKKKPIILYIVCHLPLKGSAKVVTCIKIESSNEAKHEILRNIIQSSTWSHVFDFVFFFSE